MNQSLLFLLLLPSLLVAQPDDYTQTLIDGISVQYTLTGETFPVYDSEVEFIANGSSYGLEQTDGTVAEQDFARFINLDVPAGYLNRWEAAWSITNREVVNQGDKVLWVLYLRHKPAEDASATGKVAVVVEEGGDPFDKEFEQIVDVSQNWQLYYVPIEVSLRTFAPGGLRFNLQVGFKEQDIQVGGMAVLNYGQDIPLEQLPRNLNTGNYGGNEEDANWRAPAAERIDQLRKADLTLTVLDENGEPMANQAVGLRMQRHDFKFGAAVKGSRFPGGREYDETFVDRLFNLDGKGHGFNAVVFENDLKWPGWEEEWITTNEQLRRTIDYLSERDIAVRGHVLLWPGWENMPDRMEENAGGESYLRQQVMNHLDAMLSEDGENFDARGIDDWDVLNEINTNTDLATALAGTPNFTTGREFYVDVFKRARELAPDAELYVNDYITLSLKNEAGNGIYDQYLSFIQELVDGETPIDGIGFQAHLSASPNGIYEVLATYDDFYDRFGLNAKVTEFDLPRTVDPDVLPNYVNDFLTATFSHPSMTGFLFWNWWDVDTWRNPGANLYTSDWQEKPAHAAFVNLVFNEWWTNEDLTTDAAGRVSARGFKGQYTVALTCGGTEVTTDISLTTDTSATLDCRTLLTSTQPLELPTGAVTAGPNPGAGPIQITNTLPLPLRAQLYDQQGRQLWAGSLGRGINSPDFAVPAGTYQLRFTDGKRVGTISLIRL